MASSSRSYRSRCSSAGSAPESSGHTNDSQDAFVAALDLDAIREVALSARRAFADDSGSSSYPGQAGSETPSWVETLSCSVLTPPRRGADNVVYTLDFSDDVSWVIRIPMKEPWDDRCARSMRFSIVGMEYVMARTSVPIPKLLAYSCDADCPLGHPYMLMEKVRGTRVIDVWHDAAWWTGERRKENMFESLAACMVELADLEFDKIGELDRLPDGSHTIVPFSSARSMLLLQDQFEEQAGPDESPKEFGPFRSTHEFFRALLDARRSTENRPWLALLQMFIGALVDARTDGPPFAFGHPDFDSQNIFVDDVSGRVVGIIDWDGVFVGPLQIGALVYPSWLTIDWDPMMYDGWKRKPGEHDSEEDLRKYRKMYADAVGAASGGKFASVTRNSHVLITLYLAITNFLVTTPIVYDSLGTYVFGSPDIVHSVLGGIERGGWYSGSPDEPAEIIHWEQEPAAAASSGPSEDGDAEDEHPALEHRSGEHDRAPAGMRDDADGSGCTVLE